MDEKTSRRLLCSCKCFHSIYEDDIKELKEITNSGRFKNFHVWTTDSQAFASQIPSKFGAHLYKTNTKRSVSIITNQFPVVAEKTPLPKN